MAEGKTYKSVSVAIKAYFELSAGETMAYYKTLSTDERNEYRELFAAVGITIED